jgi:DNA-binding NarL/FixJ family response regulator
VHGYLLKSASVEVLADAIRAVHAGERRLSPTLAGKALQQLEALSRAQAESGLSDQELQLLQLIGAGAATNGLEGALTQKRWKAHNVIEAVSLAHTAP